jgi:N-acetylglutamate synthase-like GNAT family acetyltransferase
VESTLINARRATPEDLPDLLDLWKDTGLPAEELARFIAEFQVGTDESEQLLGAIGMMIEGSDALLHSEAIRTGVDADMVRGSLWRRIQIVARNQGVQCVWTQEDAEFWRANGFAAPPADRLAAPKASFVDPTATWTTCFLSDPARSPTFIEEQLAVLKTSQQIESEAFQRRLKMFRTVSYTLAFLVVAACFVLLFWLALSHPEFFRRLLGR